MMNVTVRRRDESLEKWMRLVRLALELRMELARNKKRVILQFDDLHQFAIGRRAAKNEAGFFELRSIGIIEFVAMAMPLVHQERAIEMAGTGAHYQLARLRTKAHSAAFLRNLFLLVEQGNDRVRRLWIELRRMRAFQFQHIAGEFNGSDLHPETKPEVWQLLLAGILHCPALAFATPFSKSARN